MPSRQARLAQWLGERPGKRVEAGDFAELMALLGPMEESQLRHLLRESGAALHPLAAGVDQSSFARLRETLTALAECYESNGAETRREIRRVVITAKDHAKLAARNQRVTAEKRAEKEEMAAWMLTWLENPAVFPLWAELRENSGRRAEGQ